METTLQQTITANYTATTTKTNTWKKFISWCESQEQFRFGWLGAALATHGCIATPITLFFIILSGNVFTFWILAIAAMGASLITNLAAMPTKVTIPTLFLSLVIDVAIIISCISMGLNITAALA
jgi:hypothetical protein